MKKILLLVSVLLSATAFAQGHETFDYLDLQGNSYVSGSFVGEDGVTWTYGEARGDLELNGAAITLGRNRQNPMFIESDSIANGIGTLEFSYYQAFSSDVALEVFVNDQLVFTATTTDEKEIVKSTGPIVVDIDGKFVLKMNNPDGSGQVTIDDIVWNGYDVTVGIDDLTTNNFSFYPNPMDNVLNITANKIIQNLEGYNLLGQQVINTSNYSNGKVDVSSLAAGTYIFQVNFEDGTQKSFKVLK